MRGLLPPRWPEWILVAVACLGLAVLLAGAPMLVPYQGVHALLTARSLNAGAGFEVVPGIPFGKFAPLHPVALAALGRIGMAPLSAALWLNLVALGGLMLALSAYARQLSVRHAWIAMPAVLLLAPWHYLLRSVRPDLLVMAASTWALVAAVAYTREGSRRWLAICGAATAVAVTGRYMSAVTVLPVVAFLVWLGAPDLRRRLTDLALLGALGVGPLLPWIVRNQRVTGFLSGMSRTRNRRVAESLGFEDHVGGLLETGWVDLFAPDALGIRQVVYGGTSYPWRGWMLLAALAATAALVAAWSLSRRPTADDAPFGRAFADRLAAWGGLGTLIAYVVALLTIWSLSNNDPIATRYVAPLYGIAGCLVLLPFSRLTERRPRLAAALLTLCLATVLLPNAIKSARLLLGDPPGPRLMHVTAVGQRGSNWVHGIPWEGLDAIRPMRADKVGGNTSGPPAQSESR